MSADLTTALPDAALAALRAQYSADFMLAASRAAVAAPHPASAPYVEAVIKGFYDGARMAPRERERVLVALLATQSVAPSLLLAVHLYWGLMEGLAVTDLADTLGLSGVYTGLAHYTAGLKTLRITLDALAALATTAGAKLDPAAVVTALGTSTKLA
jgi:hypothetical protein